MKNKRLLLLSLTAIFIITVVSIFYIQKAYSNSDVKIEKEVKFKACISIGNCLEAPKGVDWGVPMQYYYFDKIKEAGFDSVRVPVRLSDYSKDSATYRLDEDFMKNLDSYINYALKDNLIVILDFHHFIEAMADPSIYYKDCYLNVWKQVAERYKDYPPELVFELLNEPQNKLGGDTWNEWIKDGVSTIRETNKTRKIIVGADTWNSLDGIDHLILPKDTNIILTFHYYEPNKFTFQGNAYEKGFENLSDIHWTEEEGRNYIKQRFDIVKTWADKNGVKVFLGEFGANVKAPSNDRINWTRVVREEAESHGFSYSYWEFCSGFGAYDLKSNQWDDSILKALIPDK